MSGIDLLVRVGFAVLLGVGIGIERQWRSRLTGLQTMALVSMGAALFVVLGAYTFHPNSNPAQVAGSIATGIGFLGGGVIMKQGMSVTGLNTAATLWATGAIGALAGAWMWREALTGAGIVILANGVLHPLGRRMDRLRFEPLREELPAAYRIEVVCHTEAVDRVRAQVTDVIAETGFQLKSIGAVPINTPGQTAVQAELGTDQRDDSQLENAVRMLGGEPGVYSAAWSLQSETPASWLKGFD
ncbi:MgtC/SapB family protein [Mycobacterium sp.]|jgi:putative Mg2+ transporter-C (MgtC) family protein|uniref:MgtC/SapB family protein n=1 Tax=Mycobacterium sp. TaxID=1785 RepID=UPI002D39F3D0|nr:MgtC/SapB family protein [Mycobacterium sp.]HZA11910.1 MgtC/SapB family protein [Mycobacterium sp.]